MSRRFEQFLSTIPDQELREKQREEFERERETVEKHVAEAKRMVGDMLARDANILIMDVSQGGSAQPDQFTDPDLLEHVREVQFGGATELSHGAILRHLLGFDPDDPRVTIWDVAKDPDRNDLPFPDVMTGTGGRAMPSELQPGKETENTHWLRRAADAQQHFAALGVPGKFFCLTHQLFAEGRGAEVGKHRAEREFGTVPMQVLFGYNDPELMMSASHSEEVIQPPIGNPGENFHVIAMNDYSDMQGFLYPAKPEKHVADAVPENEYIVTLQNHPEIMASYLAALGDIRAEKIRSEGLDVKQMLFQDTPKARTIFLRLIELWARQLEKKK